jgi:hypothetical protein
MGNFASSPISCKAKQIRTGISAMRFVSAEKTREGRSFEKRSKKADTVMAAMIIKA